MANKVHNSIHEKLGSASIEDLMVASNIFQRGLGKRRIIQILKRQGKTLLLHFHFNFDLCFR